MVGRHIHSIDPAHAAITVALAVGITAQNVKAYIEGVIMTRRVIILRTSRGRFCLIQEAMRIKL